MISSSLLAATDPAALQNACGDNTGWLCEQVFDWTGSKRWARVAEWFVAKPLTILVIILGAALAAIKLASATGDDDSSIPSETPTNKEICRRR